MITILRISNPTGWTKSFAGRRDPSRPTKVAGDELDHRQSNPRLALALRAAGATIAIVIDACHSGGMVRGAEDETTREVPAEELSSAAAIAAARTAAARQASTQDAATQSSNSAQCTPACGDLRRPGDRTDRRAKAARPGRRRQVVWSADLHDQQGARGIAPAADLHRAGPAHTRRICRQRTLVSDAADRGTGQRQARSSATRRPPSGRGFCCPATKIKTGRSTPASWLA